MTPPPPGRLHRQLLTMALAVAGCAIVGWPAWSQSRQTISIRGQVLSLRIYGDPRGNPVVVSSGDGGWIHLGPHVAEFLASRGFMVVGFDVKAYLSAFTSARSALRPVDEPGDYRLLIQLATKATGAKPILIGVSEGAGLSVLAATDPATKSSIAGVIGLGLPDVNELAWRWRDVLTYVTHQPPNEPSFSAAAIVARVAPVPLAVIHSTHDEFVPLAELQRVLARAGQPTRLWVVDAANHRFSDKQDELDRQLLEAIGWIRSHNAR